MVDVYYYIPAEYMGDALECGLKLSEWYDREIIIDGEERKGLSTLLNPRDDMEKYKTSSFKCVKIELSSNYCFVADRLLYIVGQQNSEAMKMYRQSIIPVEKYIFGSYRIPECVVTTTILPHQISILNSRLDSPILFESSSKLYTSNIIEVYREQRDDFYEVLLYYFYCKLAETGKLDKIENNDIGIAVFFDKGRKSVFTMRIPDLDILRESL